MRNNMRNKSNSANQGRFVICLPRLLTRERPSRFANIQSTDRPTYMPAVAKDMNKKGDFLVDYEEKVFPDVKADPGEKALVTFHTVAFEGSISIVNTLVATRLLRKGYET